MKSKLLRVFLSCLLALVSTTGYSSFANTENNTLPDNSKTNKEQQSKQEATAEHQNNNNADLKVTQKIRQELIKDKNLSTYGHNVKIITENGKVTLKGPVHSEKEKLDIEHTAQLVAGVDNVQDELEIVKKN